jgi:hypothetical protein
MQEVQEFALGSLLSSDYKHVVMRTVTLFTKEAVPPVDRYDVTLHYCLKGDQSLYELKNDDDLKSAIDLSKKTGTPKLLLRATVTEKVSESSMSSPKHNAKPPPPPLPLVLPLPLLIPHYPVMPKRVLLLLLLPQVSAEKE